MPYQDGPSAAVLQGWIRLLWIAPSTNIKHLMTGGKGLSTPLWIQEMLAHISKGSMEEPKARESIRMGSMFPPVNNKVPDLDAMLQDFTEETRLQNTKALS